MKLKKLTALVLALTMVFGTGVSTVSNSTFFGTDITANAEVEEYDLTFLGTTVTSENCDDILGDGVFRYDPETKTLFVSGDCVLGKDYEGSRNISADELTINATADSRLYGVHIKTNSIKLTGNGYLKIDSTYSRETTLETKKMTIEDANVFLWDSFQRADDGLTINNSKVKIQLTQINHVLPIVNINDSEVHFINVLGAIKIQNTSVNNSIFEAAETDKLYKILNEELTVTNSVKLNQNSYYLLIVPGDSVELTVPTPVAGKRVSKDMTADTFGTELQGEPHWYVYDKENNKEVELNNYNFFEEGEEYICEFTYYIKNIDEYEIPGELKTTVNGVEAESLGEGKYRVKFKARKNADKADITLTEPKAGAKPDLEASTTAEGIEVVGNTRWFLGDAELDESSSFEAGKTYTVKVGLKSDEDHYLAQDADVLINGVKAQFVSEESGVLTFSAELTVPEEKESSSKKEDDSSKPESKKDDDSSSSKTDDDSSSKKDDSTSSIPDEDSSKPDDSSFSGSDDDSSKSDDGHDFMLGDVNGDGKITVTDLSKVAAHIKSVKMLAEEQQKSADVNRDGKITVTDLSKIAAHIKSVKTLG